MQDSKSFIEKSVSDNVKDYFSLIIWNPAIGLINSIIADVPGILETKEIKVSNEQLHDFIFDVYKLDTRCSHDIVLPPKIARLKKHGNDHLLIKFEIKNPVFQQGNCVQAVRLKEQIRAKYKDSINNYIRDVIIHVADNYEQAKHIWELGEPTMSMATHRSVYSSFLDSLNQNKVRYMIIRGFKYLPIKPDTDLDMIVHPGDYDIFLSVFDRFKQNKLMRNDESIRYLLQNAGGERLYSSFFTERHLSDGSHLPGNYYRFDVYSDTFFPTGGRNALLLPVLYRKYLFENRVKVQNFYIPNPISEALLLICRCVYEKRTWSNKHTSRIQELLSYFDSQEFEKIASYIFNNPEGIYNTLLTQKFGQVDATPARPNLFLIRKAALAEDIIKDIQAMLHDSGYTILDNFFVTIKDDRKLFRDFYKNYDQFEDEILKINNNQCLAIITNTSSSCTVENLKQRVRSKYVQFYPPIGNIIHASDSSVDCERELALLLDESVLNFKNVGTYYSQKDI